MAATGSFMKKLGNIVREVAGKKGSSWWYTLHMAAASRAIAERIPLVDIVVEVRDSRIPMSSAFEQLRNIRCPSRHILVLNKMDLANRSQLKEWIMYLGEQNHEVYGVNSHNKENMREFLNVLQEKVRELKRNGHSGHTTTVMLVGIPNSGKSALANSLHQIGRISATEKGKLKHATVSPHPGETKDISSFKIASHPNIYILDTPGILPPHILEDEVCSNLTLTGALSDWLVGKLELAQYFLAILNSNNEYKKWGKLPAIESNSFLDDQIRERTVALEVNIRPKKQSSSDHTQDLVVNGVRRTLYDVISSCDGDLEDETTVTRLIELQLVALQKAFNVPSEIAEDANLKVGSKLLNLYRTGRLGHYTLDQLPRND